MILYHGTCTAFESSIKAHGLTGHPEYKYARENDSTTSDSIAEHNAVYLTPDKITAIVFAQFRADWMRANIGQVVMFNGVNGKVKLTGDVVHDCKPLLVTIDDAVPVHPDENSGAQSPNMFWTAKRIPVTHLTFTVLPDKPEHEYHDSGFETVESLRDYQKQYVRAEFPGHTMFMTK